MELPISTMGRATKIDIESTPFPFPEIPSKSFNCAPLLIEAPLANGKSGQLLYMNSTGGVGLSISHVAITTGYFIHCSLTTNAEFVAISWVTKSD